MRTWDPRQYLFSPNGGPTDAQNETCFRNRLGRRGGFGQCQYRQRTVGRLPSPARPQVLQCRLRPGLELQLSQLPRWLCRRARLLPICRILWSAQSLCGSTLRSRISCESPGHRGSRLDWRFWSRLGTRLWPRLGARLRSWLGWLRRFPSSGILGDLLGSCAVVSARAHCGSLSNSASQNRVQAWEKFLRPGLKC